MLAEAKFIKKKLAPIKNLADLSASTHPKLSNIKTVEEDDDEALELPDVQIQLSGSDSKRSKKSKTKSGKKDSSRERKKDKLK